MSPRSSSHRTPANADTPVVPPPPVVPFAVRPTPHLRPDLTPLDRAPPPHVEDRGPATLVRLDRETPVLVASKLRRLADDPTPWTAAEDLDPSALRAAGLALADRIATEVPRLLSVQGRSVRLPGSGLLVDDRGTLRHGRPDPDAPVIGDPADLSARLEAVPSGHRVLEVVALAIGEDLVVVDGEARAVWVHVCAPSGWDPGRAAGASLTTLHGPIPAADRLRAASRALGRAIVGSWPHVRWTWGLTQDAALARHARWLPPAPDPRPSPGELTFRAERQTTLPLPDLDLGVFTIRVHRAPLASVMTGPTRRAALTEAIATMPDALAAYKGVADRRDELLAWLDAFPAQEP